MSAANYANSYEEWHKRIAEAYRLLDSDPKLKSAVAQAHPYIWENTAGKSLDGRIEHACASLDDRIVNINRKHKDTKRYTRKIFLQDLYALCEATGKKPNDFLPTPSVNTNCSPVLTHDSCETLHALLEYISCFGNIKAFIKLFYYKCNVKEGSKKDKKELQKALSQFDGIMMPNDLIFMLAFKAEIIESVSFVFRISNPSQQQRSVAAKINQSRETSRPNATYQFVLHSDEAMQDLYCVLVRSAFTQEEQKDKIFLYNFLDDVEFLNFSWNAAELDCTDSELFLRKRWNAGKRFELSLYSYLLTCALKAIIRIQQFQHANWEDDFAEDCQMYISDNSAVRQLIKNLFLHSFFRFNGTDIVSAYEKLKPEKEITGNKNAKKADKQVTKFEQQKQKGKTIDEITARADQLAKDSR